MSMTGGAALSAQAARSSRAAHTEQAGQAGQRDHAKELSELRARIDNMEPRIDAMRRLDSVRRDSAARANRRMPAMTIDSVTAGPFKIIGVKRDISRSHGAARAAWDDVKPMFENMEHDADSIVLVVGSSGMERVLANRLGGHGRIVTLSNGRRDLWKDAYAAAMTTVLTARLAPSIRAWLGDRGNVAPQNYESVYRSLALWFPRDTFVSGPDGPRIMRRHCQKTDIATCRLALGLDDGRREANNTLLRSSFISYVVMRAPAGSIRTLSEDSSSVVPAIERIGGKPIDTLIADWLVDVREHRASGFEDAGRYAINTIFWIAALAALAMRSTRWRLG
jgi:hypothetical protein